jgi:hypothetical protein
MSIEQLRSTTREVLTRLAQGNYESVVRRCAKSRLSSKDLGAVIREYGRKLVTPPSDAYEHLDAVQVRGVLPPTWSVRVPVWTEEEGMSDLTLELTITLDVGEPRVELDDLRVL